MTIVLFVLEAERALETSGKNVDGTLITFTSSVLNVERALCSRVRKCFDGLVEGHILSWSTTFTRPPRQSGMLAFHFHSLTSYQEQPLINLLLTSQQYQHSHPKPLLPFQETSLPNPSPTCLEAEHLVLQLGDGVRSRVSNSSKMIPKRQIRTPTNKHC